MKNRSELLTANVGSFQLNQLIMPRKKKPFPIMFLDHITVPVFKERVNLVFAESVAIAAKELDITIPNVNEANAIVFTADNCLYIIMPYDVTRGVIAHEIFHLATEILDRRGLTFSHDSEEAYAHLIDWLTDEIYSYHDGLKKKQEKFRKKNLKIKL